MFAKFHRVWLKQHESVQFVTTQVHSKHKSIQRGGDTNDWCIKYRGAALAGFVVILFRFFENSYFCFFVAICDVVQDMNNKYGYMEFFS